MSSSARYPLNVTRSPSPSVSASALQVIVVDGLACDQKMRVRDGFHDRRQRAHRLAHSLLRRHFPERREYDGIFQRFHGANGS